MADFIDDKIHYLPFDSDGIELPSEFTYPFHYVPHPLTVMAAREVQDYLASRTDWTKELSEGKMFGVLIVQTPDGKVGYLAAFSGNLAGSNLHRFLYLPYTICCSRTDSSASKRQTFRQSTDRLRNWKAVGS